MASKLSMPSMSLISTTVLNKSLSSMVKGIRGHKDAGEIEYINKCLTEIKEELATPYADVKAQAIQKLIYLQMLGYDVSFASFNIVEVMSAPWFGHKRIGYLAASLCFTKDTDVILLTTHLFRKGFTQPTVSSGAATSDGLQYETGAALACLATIATPDLSMDLLNDVYTCMNSSRPYIRKKAILTLLRFFRVWPKSLRLSFDRLKEKLNDENPGVVSAAVYVICELAAKNPKNYLSLAPQLFKILTTSSNNWVLIKVVKLLGALSPLEPRLAKKLLEPLTDIVTTTPAKSLLYEAVNCMLSGELRSKSCIRLCLEKLRGFIEDADQNLKYLGLLGLHKLMLKHPRVVSEHKDLILACLNDEDITIRMRALDLISSMVNQRNLQGIMRKLQEHLIESEGNYREHVLTRMLTIGSQDNYIYVNDFEFYISILVELTHLIGASRENALRINSQLTDVSIRVPGVRRYAVKSMSDLLIAGRLLNVSASMNPMSEVLHSGAFIVGEFSEYVTEHQPLIATMLGSQVTQLTGETQAIFIHAAMKVFAMALYQPFDQSETDLLANADISETKVKDLLGRKNLDDDSEENSTDNNSDEMDEAMPQESITKTSTSNDDDADPEAEEEELDSNGVKKRKNKPQRRSFLEHCHFIGAILDDLYTRLPLFCVSDSIEVQERAVIYYQFVQWLIDYAQLHPFMKTKVKNDSKAEDKSETQPELNLLGTDSAVSSPRSYTGPMPDKQRLTALAIQLNVLFSERLNPVNPKAQRKVPIPKGLDLASPINIGWDKDSEDEESEVSETSESEEDDGSRRKRSKRSKEKERESKKKKKEKEKKRDKKSKFDYDDEDYSKPLTTEEKAESKARLEARQLAQQNNPFYLKPTGKITGPASETQKSRPSTSTSLDLGLRDREEKSSKKKDRKHRSKKRGESDEDDDDIFATVGSSSKTKSKSFKVMKNAEMPSDAAPSSEDERKADDDDDDDDLSKPLGKNDKIPTATPYGADKEKGRKKKKSKDRERDSKDKDRKRDKNKSRDRGDEQENMKSSKDKAKDREPSVAALDPLDPFASPVKARKSKDKDKEKEKDRSEKRSKPKADSDDKDGEREKKQKKKKSSDRDRRRD